MTDDQIRKRNRAYGKALIAAALTRDMSISNALTAADDAVNLIYGAIPEGAISDAENVALSKAAAVCAMLPVLVHDLPFVDALTVAQALADESYVGVLA